MGINVVVQAGDLIISVPLRHLNWVPRLTTSRKLLKKYLTFGIIIIPRRIWNAHKNP
jgi:hypothetical protein